MATMYSALVYPQVATGGSYTTPVLPSTFVSLGYTSPTWNPFSANSADRTQWWVDTAGTLTQAQAMTACYGAAGVIALQAAAALSAGLAITSTGTPALDATYLYGQSIATQQLAETTSIILNGTFADGAATIEWPYTTGAAVTMTIAEFKVIVTTIAAWVSALTKCINGQSTTLPSASATIP
ncbi:MAG: hypothetical protein PHZ23_15870 [Acidiphilium sp.]|nr:hypothetical protein [Acidiphilium sp.]